MQLSSVVMCVSNMYENPMTFKPWVSPCGRVPELTVLSLGMLCGAKVVERDVFRGILRHPGDNRINDEFMQHQSKTKIIDTEQPIEVSRVFAIGFTWTIMNVKPDYKVPEYNPQLLPSYVWKDFVKRYQASGVIASVERIGDQWQSVAGFDSEHTPQNVRISRQWYRKMYPASKIREVEL